jgi:hypothetical protein
MYIVEYQSALKKIGIFSFAAKQMVLEDIMLGEKKPKIGKQVLPVLSLMWKLKNYLLKVKK